MSQISFVNDSEYLSFKMNEYLKTKSYAFAKICEINSNFRSVSEHKLPVCYLGLTNLLLNPHMSHLINDGFILSKCFYQIYFQSIYLLAVL